jgi:exopolysaccharide biosynthesis polyprenyl glycosylphosphotransferase
MFSYRARGLAGLVAMVQGSLALGFCALAQFSFNRDGFCCGDVARVAGPWVFGILATGIWRCLSARDGSAPDLLDCLGRTVPAFLVAGTVWLDRILAGGASVNCAAFGLSGGVLLLLVCSHWALPRWLSVAFFPAHHSHRAVLLGSASKIKELSGMLEKSGPLGMRAVAWLSEEGEVPFDTGIPLFGDASHLEDVVGLERVSHVVLADMPSEARLKQRLHQCEKWGVRLVVAQNLEARYPGRFRWESHGFWCFGAAYSEPLQNPLNRFFKRALDLAVCVPAILLVLFPVAALTWVFQRRQSPGPLFYRQSRHGRANTVFQVWKFRTMHSDHRTEAHQATRDDCRVYPFGAWLRRHSLDELPQFLNVLTGEMSVVGPRPHFVEHSARFEKQERYHIRSFVKPGVTGLAQVNGCRGEVRHPGDMERRVQWDICYLENWSLLLDCCLIFRTLRVVFKPPETAY